MIIINVYKKEKNNINYKLRLRSKIMKVLMKSNIYDVDDTIIIAGSCLKSMQREGFKKLEQISNNIYELCLEETHINMAITKIGGMIRTKKVKRIIFASVDRSPHCIQLHYIQDELQKMMDLTNVKIENYVVVDNELLPISPQVISMSKNLKELSEIKSKIGENDE